MKLLPRIRRVIFVSLLPSLLMSCGAQEATSELEGGNPVTTHRYNSTGSGSGITGKWFTQIGTPAADGSITLSGDIKPNAEECLVFGPYNNYAPVNGIGHVDGQVDLILSGGSVKVDIVSNQVVLDSKIIDAPARAPKTVQTIDLKGAIFSAPLTGVEVRVCQPRAKTHQYCEQLWPNHPPHCINTSFLYLKVLETRILYN